MRTTLVAILLAALLYAGGRPLGTAPPLGPMLDPANGVWAVARRTALPRDAEARLPGLGARVRVLYDARGVPHIFAATEEDAARALGYVVARDRLFQLEVQTRAAAGTLAALAGAPALPADREMRRLGMARSAERRWRAADTTSPSARQIIAYAQGVNAWIDALRPRDYPIEYRLLGRRPVRWEPVNSIHLINRMGWTLAYTEKELRRYAVQAVVGRAAAEALFPVNAPIQEPIQPNGLGAPRFVRAPLPPPGPPDPGAEQVAAALAAFLPGGGATIRALEARAGDALGSNNWVVAPRRARNGHALLAGDPHLELTLPSVWYEAHLVVPGRLDVYGVTLPGAPWIVIGFNREVAWTFTNTDADVVDYYEERVDDAARPGRYFLDGSWRQLEWHIETYRGPKGDVLSADTVPYTHRGPMRRVGSRWLSMRWTVLEADTEQEALRRVGFARSAAELLRGMALFGAPAQNVAVADRAGTIAIRATGTYPLRPADGRGDIVRDGSTSRSDWRGAWPVERYPQAMNPAQGFLASANQQPVDPLDEPTYLGADWVAPWRAMRINALLRADSAVTPDAMRSYQTDPGSARAEHFVPFFLDAAQRVLARPDAAPGAGSRLREAATLLGEWDRRYTKDGERAVLFELAMSELEARTWDELRPPADAPYDAPVPSSMTLARLLADPASAWWDDRRTPDMVETRDDVLAASLAEALVRARREHGEPGARWRWSRVRHANIYHLLRVPSFSALGLTVQGGPGALNPSAGSGTHGASWRMVVELGPEVRAWGTYPGGQSGNPVSPRYADRLPRWVAGELEPLVFPRDSADLMRAGVSAALTLTPER